MAEWLDGTCWAAEPMKSTKLNIKYLKKYETTVIFKFSPEAQRAISRPDSSCSIPSYNSKFPAVDLGILQEIFR